ncbi:MAG: AbrB/MazE/SpoVT family DNA-binding domain-containing protein [Trueperaceae bacterium]
MKGTVQRWGNSLAIRIPRAYARDLSVDEGSEVELRIDGPSLVVTPSSTPSLEALLAAISDDNLHAEIDTGPGQGREAW